MIRIRRAVTATHERAVLQAGGVVIRYGQLYGPGTFYPAVPPQPPRIHVDDAARQTLPALGVPPGMTIVIDDRAAQPGSPRWTPAHQNAGPSLTMALATAVAMVSYLAAIFDLH